MTSAESDILKVQLDANGQVWYADGISVPTASAQSCDSFVQSLSPQRRNHVRVIGTHTNAPLIVSLYRCVERLEVASPTICETAAERCNPEIALYRMRQCLRPASLGGWHRVTDLDYPSYVLASQFAAAGTMTDESVGQVFRDHPARHDLLFLPTVNQMAAMELISVILDPRWFIDTRNPYRLSRLKMYLGLTPNYVEQVIANRITCKRVSRCQLAMTAWGFGAEAPTTAGFEQPGNFLWRVSRAAGDCAKGGLRATQVFITYLVRTWQQQLLSQSVQRVEMFTPTDLLQGHEVDAYRAHSQTRGHR